MFFICNIKICLLIRSAEEFLLNICASHGPTYRTPKLRLITIVMCVDYFVVAMLFFGLTLGASSLNVNHFVYVAIAGLVELPSATIMIPIVMYFGRRKMLIFDFSGCAVALLAQPLISEGTVLLTAEPNS